MATPDENITGYGGQPQTGLSTSSSMDTPRHSSAPATEDMKNKAHEASQHLTEQAKTQGREQFERYRGSAAGEIEKIAQSAKLPPPSSRTRTGPASRSTSPAPRSTSASCRRRACQECRRTVPRRHPHGPQQPGAVHRRQRGARLRPDALRQGSSERAQSGDYGSHRPHLRRDHHDRASTHYGDAGHLPSQRELDEHIGSGAGVGTVAASAMPASPT